MLQRGRTQDIIPVGIAHDTQLNAHATGGRKIGETSEGTTIKKKKSPGEKP